MRTCEVEGLEVSTAILLNFRLRFVFIRGTKYSLTESLSTLLIVFRFQNLAKLSRLSVSSLSDWYLAADEVFGMRTSQMEEELSSECLLALRQAENKIYEMYYHWKNLSD